jgi:NADH-quinone oxidoreductase subunit N
MSEITILLPEIFLSLAACALLMLGAFAKNYHFKSMNLVVASIIAAAIYLLLYKVPEGEIWAFDHLFKSNMLIVSLKMIILTASILYILIYKGHKFSEDSMLKDYEFPTIMLFSITGMLCMLSANHFLSFYVSLELQSLCLYVMAAFEREDGKASEAGLKYFVLGSFSSGLLLFGISLIYGFTGNLGFDQLHTILSANPSSKIAIGVIIGIIMLLIGLFFKVSAAPFHMWTPDVYQGSPTIVTSFFATIVKVASVGFLLMLATQTLDGWKLDLQPILIIITCASVLVGAIGALKQNNIKRLLAYSSIGHVGFMLLGISTFKIDLSVLTYLIIYVSMTLPVFAIIMGIENNGKAIENIQDLAGLSKVHPIASAFMAILMFSLAGIPPFAGFFAKFYVLQAAINAELYVAVVIAMLAAVISAYYYLKIVKIMYLDEVSGDLKVSASCYSKVIISLLVLYNLCYIIL